MISNSNGLRRSSRIEEKKRKAELGFTDFQNRPRSKKRRPADSETYGIVERERKENNRVYQILQLDSKLAKRFQRKKQAQTNNRKAETKPIDDISISNSTKVDVSIERARTLFWRHINQFYTCEPSTMLSKTSKKKFDVISKQYEKDKFEFLTSIRSTNNSKLCSVCGRMCHIKNSKPFSIYDKVFKCLVQAKSEYIKDCSNITINNLLWYQYEWIGYYNSNESIVHVCGLCLNSLERNRIPKCSRTNVHIALPPKELQGLSEFEQLLIAPVVPLVNVYRFNGFGQYQSKGQCITFHNDIQKIASHLPYHPNDIILNIADLYGTGTISLRPKLIKNALIYLKLNGHPSYQTITISLENFKILQEISEKLKLKNNANSKKSQTCISQNIETKQVVNTEPTIETDLNNGDDIYMQNLRDIGQRQNVENEFAKYSTEMPISVESTSYSDLKKVVSKLFKAVSNGNAQLYSSTSTSYGWTDRFPCSMPDGNGGPMGVHVHITLKEWIKYVLEIDPLNFKNHIMFICYSNILTRRNKIIGISAKKPISTVIADAVEKLVKIAKIPYKYKVPDSTLQLLAKSVSVFIDNLPGSMKDMNIFRKDLLSMMVNYGPPTYFLTLSAADSIWPEVYMDITKQPIDDIRSLKASERLELLCKHPVQVTVAWKKRLKAFLNFILKGKSKPLGEVSQYAIKSEWQGRLSEHAHMLIWTKRTFPKLGINIKDNDYSVSDSNDELILQTESTCSAMLPFKNISKSLISEEDKSNRISNKSILSKTLAIQEDPISLASHISEHDQIKLFNLIELCQSHSCSAYCTNRYTKSCKSLFPFSLQNETAVTKYIDKTQNEHYRMTLRRNNPYINNYNLPILNLWRANMDIQVRCGKSLAALSYVAYYTSKTDKMANINDVLMKLKNIDPDSETQKKIRKILLALDTYRPVGAPEASSNLLGYPHWKTSWKTVRIDTRIYLEALQNPNISIHSDSNTNDSFSNKNENSSGSNLNSLLKPFTSANDDFSLKTESHNQKYKIIDSTIRNYFLRPTELEELSLYEFTEKYRTTNASRPQTGCLLNSNGKLVKPRNIDEIILVDLKFYITPDGTNPKWCISALALHIPHRNVYELFTEKSVIKTFKIKSKATLENGDIKFKNLQKFTTALLDLETSRIHHSNFSSITPVESRSNENKTPEQIEKLIGEKQQESLPFSLHDYDTEDDLEEYFNPIDTDDMSSSFLHARKILKDDNLIKTWSGNWFRYDTTNISPFKAEVNDKISKDTKWSSLTDHLEFMDRLKKGENPKTQSLNVLETSKITNSSSSKKTCAEKFLIAASNECKTLDQKNALKLMAKHIEDYYFSKEVNENCSNQICTVIGIPGAGKSWLISKIREWISIRLSKSDFRRQTNEFKTISRTYDISIDPVTAKISKIFNNDVDGDFGRVVVLAPSGAAAGSAKGFTIHHALGLQPITKHSISKGIEKIPELSHSRKASLFKAWCGVKVVIIDECYTMAVHMLSIIDERLKEIFSSDTLFAGIMIILIGDPRQIPPVAGKPVYYLEKFFCKRYDPEKVKQIKTHKSFQLTKRELHAYDTLQRNPLRILLEKSIRLGESDFSKAVIDTAKYKLQSKDLKILNQVYKPREELLREEWLDKIWMFSNWNAVNNHISKTTEFMARKRGILRLWTTVSVPKQCNLVQARKAVKAFYTTDYKISSSWTPPPFIDYFFNQIISLKKNWNPLWGLYNNAKCRVKEIAFRDENEFFREEITLEKAIDRALKGVKIEYQVLVEPFTFFKGISASEEQKGIVCVPWCVQSKRFYGVTLQLSCPNLIPANAITIHQAQGATFDGAVTTLDRSCLTYGLSNVALSRVSNCNNFALSNIVTKEILQPQPIVSSFVEKEYENCLRNYI